MTPIGTNPTYYQQLRENSSHKTHQKSLTSHSPNNLDLASEISEINKNLLQQQKFKNAEPIFNNNQRISKLIENGISKTPMTAANKNFIESPNPNKTPQPTKVSGEAIFLSKAVRKNLIDNESFDITFDPKKIDKNVLIEKP